MKLFKNRFDKSYLSNLKKELSIQQLIKSSFHIANPIERDGKVFDKCCRINFMGLTATTLLDIGCNYLPDNTIPLQFQDVMSNVDKLNDSGIFLEINFLFAYPYSASFLSLIQAETTTRRSSTEEPTYLMDFQTAWGVDQDVFSNSATIQNLKNSLGHLQQLMETPKWDTQTVNTVRIRFAPTEISFCMLMLNNFIYYDPYLYSKNKRMNRRLSFYSPVVQLDREKDMETIKYFEDHFRYIWDLDATMVCDDATFYIPDIPNTLKKMKFPNQVSYDKKAEYLRNQRLKQSNLSSSDDEIRNWKFKVHHLLKHYSSDIKPAPSIETVFIACSWHDSKDGRFFPNEYAKLLAEWLDNDFGKKRSAPCLLVQILEAPAGSSLTNEIYPHLRDATMGIVILTADIKSETGQYYSKPNTYHELGFLMSQVEIDRLLVLKEGNTYVPTTIAGVVLDFSSSLNKLAFCYRDIIVWVRKNCYLANDELIIHALTSHIKRLKNMKISGQLEQAQADKAINRIINTLDNLNSTIP